MPVFWLRIEIRVIIIPGSALVRCRTNVGKHKRKGEQKMNKGCSRQARKLGIGLGLGVAVWMGVGCAEPGFEQFQGEIVELRDQIATDQAAWQERFDALPAGDVALPMARARLESTAAQLARAEAAVEESGRVAAEAAQSTDPIGSLIGAVAPWLPEPVRTPLVLGGALVLSTARARQLKKGAVSIAASLRRVMADDPQLAEKLREHAGTLRAIQTPTAARIVDEVDTQRPLIRLPI